MTKANGGWTMRLAARATLLYLALCTTPNAGVRAQQAESPVPPGLYAGRQYVSNRALTRPSNRYLRVRTTSLLLHRVRASPAGLSVETRYCSVQQEPLGRVRTSIGPAFVAAMPPWVSPLEVGAEGEKPRSVQLEEHVMVLGAELDDPASDPLPTSDDDTRVTDPDGDGKPGVTVSVDGFVSGQVYLVQRLSRGLLGTVDEDGRIAGTVIGSGDQVVIGASSGILKTFTPRFEYNPDPKRNTFVWVPVADDYTCERVIADRETLFGKD